MKRNMKKNRLWFVGMSFIFCTVIYSCLQDEWETDNNKGDEKVIVGNNKELTVTAAQQWYEEHNKPVVTVRSVDNDENEILTKPKWEEAKESRQSNFEVVETTLMTNGSTMFMDSETKIRFNPKTDAKRVHNIARMVVIKNLKTGKVCNFIMIFVGTYDYLKTTRTLGKNSYLHRQPDFNGDVYFFKPGEGLVNGWRYRNGKITARISRGTEEGFRMSTTRGTYQRCHTESYWVYDTNCWGDSYFDDEFGWGVSSNCETISYPVYDEVCETVDDGVSEQPVEPWTPNEQPGGYEPPKSNDEPQKGTPEYYKKELEKILPNLSDELKKMDVDISNTQIRFTKEGCSANAQLLSYGNGGIIEVCSNFFNYLSQDQTAILWHEVYHLNNDDPNLVRKPYNFDYDLMSSTPPTILQDVRIYVEWLWKDVVNNDKENLINEDIKYYLTIYTLLPPEHYKHEIATYEAEINNCPNVSEHYRAEREYNYWKNKELLKLSEQNYKNN